MEAIPVLDSDSNQRNTSQDRRKKTADLIYEAHSSKVVPSDTDDTKESPLRACRFLAKAIKCPSV